MRRVDAAAVLIAEPSPKPEPVVSGPDEALRSEDGLSTLFAAISFDAETPVEPWVSMLPGSLLGLRRGSVGRDFGATFETPWPRLIFVAAGAEYAGGTELSPNLVSRF